jgi:uncharacterized protein YbaR (Trm112 family)
MNRELLDILACPRCKGDISLDLEGNRLCCCACRVAYRIDDGIPILLVDEAVSCE